MVLKKKNRGITTNWEREIGSLGRPSRWLFIYSPRLERNQFGDVSKQWARQKREFYLLNWKSVVNNVCVSPALSPGGWGRGEAGRGGLLRQHLWPWGESCISGRKLRWFCHRKYGLLPLRAGDLRGIEIGCKEVEAFTSRGYKINRGEVKFTNAEKYARWDIYTFWAQPVFSLPEYLSKFKMQPTLCINPEYLTESVIALLSQWKRGIRSQVSKTFPQIFCWKCKLCTFQSRKVSV